LSLPKRSRREIFVKQKTTILAFPRHTSENITHGGAAAVPSGKKMAAQQWPRLHLSYEQSAMINFGHESKLKSYIIDVNLIKDMLKPTALPYDHYLDHVDSGVKTAEDLINALDKAGFSQVDVRTFLESIKMGDIADEAGLATAQETPAKDNE
jgi:hypothetical protein